MEYKIKKQMNNNHGQIFIRKTNSQQIFMKFWMMTKN